MAVLVGIAVCFGGGWIVFGSSGDSSSITRAQAEQLVIRAGLFDAAECSLEVALSSPAKHSTAGSRPTI